MIPYMQYLTLTRKYTDNDQCNGWLIAIPIADCDHIYQASRTQFHRWAPRFIVQCSVDRSQHRPNNHYDKLVVDESITHYYNHSQLHNGGRALYDHPHHTSWAVILSHACTWSWGNITFSKSLCQNVLSCQVSQSIQSCLTSDSSVNVRSNDPNSRDQINDS